MDSSQAGDLFDTNSIVDLDETATRSEPNLITIPYDKNEKYVENLQVSNLDFLDISESSHERTNSSIGLHDYVRSPSPIKVIWPNSFSDRESFHESDTDISIGESDVSVYEPPPGESSDEASGVEIVSTQKKKEKEKQKQNKNVKLLS